MKVIPVTMKAANEFVLSYHRHHGKVRGCKFCIGVIGDDGALHGVAVVGRPVSRYLDDGTTAEVTRYCTNGQGYLRRAVCGTSSAGSARPSESRQPESMPETALL